MPKIPTFTIVTPSYNQVRYIERTIKSIIEQAGNFKIQYIIADGGSTDGCVEVIKKYDKLIKSPQFKPNCKGVTLEWWSRKDKGQSDAINQGWAKATGEYVAYLNSDDLYYSGALEEARLAFEKHPQAGAVYSSWIDIDEDDRHITKHTGVIEFDLDFQINTGNILPQPATFIRKSVLDDIGLLNPKYHYAMDYDIWTRIGKKYPLQFVGNRYWAGFRIHEGSKSVAVIDKFWPEVREISRVNGGRFFSHMFFLHYGDKYPWLVKPIYKIYRAFQVAGSGDWQSFQRKLRNNVRKIRRR